MSRRVYIQLSGRSLLVVRAKLSRKGIKVEHVVAHRFEDMGAAADEARVGERIGTLLGEIKSSGAKVTIGLPRSVAMCWRTGLSVEALQHGEIVAASRLQLGERSSLDSSAAGVAVDLEGCGEDPMAFAVPGERLAWWKDVGERGGFRVERVTLNAFGLAAMVEGDDALLVLDRAGETGEDVAARGGRLLHSGAVARMGRLEPALVGGGDQPASGERLTGLGVEAAHAIEASRASVGDAGVRGVRVLAEPGAEIDLDALADRTSLPADDFRFPVSVKWAASEMPANAMRAAGLIGLALRDAMGLATPDLNARPKVAKRTSPVRAAALLTLMGVVVIAGGVWALADGKTRALDSEIAQAKTDYETKIDQVRSHFVLHAQVTHAQEWRKAGPSLLDHLAALRSALPGPETMLLNEYSAQSTVGIGFTKGKERPYPGTWTTDARIETTLEGEAVSRTAAAGIRGHLIDDGVLEIETRGPDEGRGFRYEVTTRPAKPAPEASGKDEAKKTAQRGAGG